MDINEVAEMLEQMDEELGGRKVDVSVEGTELAYLDLKSIYVNGGGCFEDEGEMLYFHDENYNTVIELHTHRRDESLVDSIERGNDGSYTITFYDAVFDEVCITPCKE